MLWSQGRPAQQTRGGPFGMRLRRSGQGTSPCFRPRLRPRLALAVASATGTETDPTRADPPLRGATPEIESVDREEILVENGSVS